MKRFIAMSSYQNSDSLEKGIYIAVDNQKLQSDREFSFPILAVIDGYVQEGEYIEVAYIQSKMQNAIRNTEAFREQLDCLSKEKGFEYHIDIVEVEYNNMLDTQLNLFYDLINLIKDGDDLYACITYGTKPIPLVENMVLNYASEICEETRVSCVVYGQKDYESGEMKIYDVTSLYLLDGIVRSLGRNGVKNPIEHIRMLIE